MIFVKTSPDGQTFEKLIPGFGAFRREFRDLGLSWVADVTDEHLIAQGVPARVLHEVPPPTLDYGQSRTFTAELQEDGTWLQVWDVDTITLAEAKAELRGMARSILAARVDDLSPVELALAGEVGRARVDAAPGTNTATKYPLIDAVRVARSLTFTQAATFCAQLTDAWTARGAQYAPKYLDVVARIQAASTIAEAKAIQDELEAFVP